MGQTARVDLSGHAIQTVPVGAGAPAVVGRKLGLAYGRHPVLVDAEFEIPSGAVTALVGPNGAGKSSLLNAMVGLLRVVSGRIDVLGGAPEDGRRRVAYVLQAARVDERLPITVREVVSMGRFARRGPFRRLRREDRIAVDEAMARLEVDGLATRQLHELSGGQRQRVFIAQGLAQQAELLLLDEPVTGLDLVSRRRILEVVDEERAAGRTVIMSTHDLAEAAETDHVLLLSGRVIASGPPSEVLTTDNLSRAYGGRLLRLAEGLVLIDDPHHHAPGHDHTVCATDDER